MLYKGYEWEFVCSYEERFVRLHFKPSGLTLTSAVSVFINQESMEKILDELIEKGNSLILKNDDAFFDPMF